MIALYDKVLGGPVFLDHGVLLKLYFKKDDKSTLKFHNGFR